MATAKKSTAKKKPVAKKAPVKKPVKKVVARKAAVTKKTSVKKAPQMKSFRISKEDASFTTFKITRQTIYWTVLICFIIFVQLWILKLQIEVSTYLENQLFTLENGL